MEKKKLRGAKTNKSSIKFKGATFCMSLWNSSQDVRNGILSARKGCHLVKDITMLSI